MIYYKAGSVTIRDAVSSDAFNLAPNMREEDKIEIHYSHNRTPKSALSSGYSESLICLAVEMNGKIIAMFGVVAKTILGRTASVWLLASPELDKIQKILVKHSRHFIDLFLSYYPYLENFVSYERKRTLRWLKHIGATIEEPNPYGIEGKLFRRFYFRREA